MVTDTLVSDKTLRNSDEVVEKLISLRDEYWEKRDSLSSGEIYLMFKINSCLYERKK
jgi:hypothetical protein